MTILKMMGRTVLALMAISILWPLTGQSPFTSPAESSPIETSSQQWPPLVAARQNAPYAIRRLDFRIEGKSCPACLHAIENKLKSIRGVQDAAVMLRNPFYASVVYRAEDANADYILTMLKAKEANIGLVDVNDSEIDKMPDILLPPLIRAAKSVKHSP